MISAMSSQSPSSSPHRNMGTSYDDHTADDAHKSNINTSSISPIDFSRSNNLRKRHNATKANTTNGEYRVGQDQNKRKQEQQTTTEKKHVHGLPTSLYPFVHMNDPTQSDLGGYSTPPRTPSPKRNRPVDIEEQALGSEEDYDTNNNKCSETIEFGVQSNDNNSDNTNDSLLGEDSFNNSGYTAFSGEDGDDGDAAVVVNKEQKRLQDPPSVGGEEVEGYKTERKKNDDRSDCGMSYRDNNSNNDNHDDADSKVTTTTISDVIANVQKSRRYVGKLVNNEFVQLGIIVLIVINALMMGLATMDFVTENPDTTIVFGKIDKSFLVIFSVEVAMQLYYFGFALFLDGWLVFDFFVVIISWAFESLQVVRAFRIFRAFRLVTRVKPLRDLVLALGQVLPRMTAISALLIIIFYVFAVLFTELFSDLEMEDINYFESLPSSLFSCFQMMTMEWGDVCREVMQQKSWAWIPFVTFVAIAGFIVFNLIVAVVVEAVAATEETVRALDGIESDTPQDKLEEAQERIDLLQYHLIEMMNQQEQIQAMLESMAGGLLHLETERMKAEHRETRLRNEIERRIEYQKKFESKNNNSQEQEQEHTTRRSSMSSARERRNSERKERVSQRQDDMIQSLHGDESSRTPGIKKKKSLKAWTVKPNMKKEGSGKSFGTHDSHDSASSEFTQTPNDGSKSAPTVRRKSALSSSITGAGEPEGDKKEKAKESWKKLLAVQKL